jgi:hypothetical protein
MKKNLIYASLITCTVGFLISCEEILFVDDISNESIEALAPISGTIVNSGTVSFTWQSIVDAERYKLQIATPSFANAAQILIDSTTQATTFSKEIIAGNYQWRVKAINSAYETDYTTHTFTATGTSVAQSIVNLVLPEDNTITNITNQTFTWNAVLGATEYRVQVWNPDINGTKEEDTTILNTSKSHTFTDGNYLWQVRAQNATENSPYATREIQIDTTAPNTPVLESPANNNTSATTSVNFTWGRTDIEGSTEIDSIYVYSDAALTLLNFKDIGASKAYTKTMNPENYFWILKSFDVAGNESTQSATFTFTIN